MRLVNLGVVKQVGLLTELRALGQRNHDTLADIGHIRCVGNNQRGCERGRSLPLDVTVAADVGHLRCHGAHDITCHPAALAVALVLDELGHGERVALGALGAHIEVYIVEVAQEQLPLVASGEHQNTGEVTLGHRQRVAVEVSIIAVAHNELVALSIVDSAVGGRIGLAESQHAISSVPSQILNLDQLARVLELRLLVALSLEVGNLAINRLHLSRNGKTVELTELLEDLQLHTAGLPDTLGSVPLGITQQVLAIILANPAVLHVQDEFLSNTVVGSKRTSVERDADAARLVLDVHHLVEVSTGIISTDPSADNDVFLDGVAEVSPILPILCFEFGNGGVGRVRCTGHDHRRIVKVLLATRGHNQHEQHAQT